MKLAAQEGVVPGEGLGAKLRLLEELGVEGIELSSHELFERLPEIKRELSHSPVKVCAICPGARDVLIAAEKEERARRIEGLKALLRAAGELGAPGVIVVPVFGRPAFPDLRPWKSDVDLEREYFLHVLGEEILPVAAREGTAIFLEPLNRYETHLLNRLEQAVEYCRRLDGGSVKVMADLFHMAIEEANLERAIEEAGTWIGHVHLADSNRRLPGEGHTDFAAPFRALKRNGYTGYLSLECGRGDEVAFRRSIAHLRRLLEAAEE